MFPLKVDDLVFIPVCNSIGRIQAFKGTEARIAFSDRPNQVFELTDLELHLLADPAVTFSLKHLKP